MLATGGSAIVAKKMGRGKSKEARSNFTLVGNIMQVLYQNLFVTAGKPALGLVLSIAAGIANIVFDYIFIVLMQMGIKGAALGTGIGYMIPTIVGTIFFMSRKRELHFCKSKIDILVLLKSCSNGASEMVSQLATAVTTFLFNAIMMKLLGEDGVAAITVIIYSGFLLTTLYIGFSMGVAPVISYNYGSENLKQLKKVVIFSFGFLFSGCNIFSSALFTALSNGKVSAIISFLRTFGFITAFLLILPRFLNVTGVWLAIPIAELLTFILTICLIARHRKHYNYL